MNIDDDGRLRALEHGLQALLLGWTNETGREIESVRVDTRNFANLKVEVFLKPKGEK